jgi:hypothetical protein
MIIGSLDYEDHGTSLFGSLGSFGSCKTRRAHLIGSIREDVPAAAAQTLEQGCHLHVFNVLFTLFQVLVQSELIPFYT